MASVPQLVPIGPVELPEVVTAPPQDDRRSWLATYFNKGSIPFWTVHAAAIAGVAWYGWSWSGFAWAIGFYVIRMFFLTAGYHRYFAHRSFKTSRAFQLVLAVGGQTCVQMGALWWAGNHRAHHRHSDQPQDLHSPRRRGFWWSHIGWFLDGRHQDTDETRIHDFAKYPELRWLNNRSRGLLPPLVLALSCWAIGGLHAMLWAFFVLTVLLWHGTFTINSLAHMIGRRRYDTSDDSKNSFMLAVITLGEGWHNNHHHHQSSAAQGFKWWELDITYYGLRALQAVGVIWDVRPRPKLRLEPPANSSSR